MVSANITHADCSQQLLDMASELVILIANLGAQEPAGLIINDVAIEDVLSDLYGTAAVLRKSENRLRIYFGE